MKMNEATLPSSWEITALENVCEPVAGNPAPQGHQFFENGKFNFVRVQDMGRMKDNTYLFKTKGKVNEQAIFKLRLFPKGSVLFTKSGASTLNNQRAILGKDCYVVSHIAAVLPQAGISSEWIYFSLVCVDFADLAHSTVMPSLPLPKVKSIPVAIPPTNEQRRIVAKIEELFSELDKSIENLKTARAQLKVYRQALLKHAFEGKLTAQWRAERNVIPAKAGIQPFNDMDSRLRGNDEPLETADAMLKRIQQERAQRHQQQLADWEAAGKQGSKPKAPKPLPPLTAEELAELPELPEGWGWVRPQDICSPKPYSIGIGPFGSNLKVSDYRKSGVPLIFVKNITRSNFFLDLKYIDEIKYRELVPHSVNALDLLITKMGDPPGDCEIYPARAPNAVLTADCLKFRLWEKFANRTLYKFCINSNFVKRQLGLITKGVAQKKISVERFKTVCLPFFSVEEQQVLVQKIEAKLSEVDQLELTITASLQQAEALRQSILKKAFSGKLVPQDSHDEPASALLARIKAERAGSGKSAASPRRIKKVSP